MARRVPMICLLDTCVLLWLADDPLRLPADVRKMLAAGNSVVHVSAISALELGIKVARGKLQLPMPVNKWFPAICYRNELHILPLDGVIAASSTELPAIHNDPFDRILIATAIRHQLRLATPDVTIRSCPGLKTLWQST